jgi:hypothetical protein
MVVIVAMKLGGEGGILKRGPADQRVGRGKHSQSRRRPRPCLWNHLVFHVFTNLDDMKNRFGNS